MGDFLPLIRRFVSELRRRRVLRVAGAYAAVSFIIWQAADIAFPALRLPDWTLTLVVVLVLLGFPFALIFAWIFDVTPRGLERTDPAPATAGSGAPAAGDAVVAAPALTRVHNIAAVAGVVILAVAAGAFVILPREAADDARELSIAVLPFANGSGEEESDYLSDGLTEAIQSRLSRLEGVWVTSRTSALSYRGSTKQLRTIGQELGVAYVVEGSVRRAGQRLRISASLIDAASDRTLWSETFDRDVRDIFDVEAEIAERIAGSLRVRLTAAQRGRLSAAGTSSVAAYELYMQARQVDRGTPTTDWAERRSLHAKYVALLRQALELDSTYGPAWAELSRAYLRNPDLPYTVRNDSARALAERAVRQSPDLPHGYVALGTLLMGLQDDGAAAQFGLALERDPNNVPALLASAALAHGELRMFDAGRLALRAARLAPSEFGPASHLASIYRVLGDHARAEEWLHRYLTLLPGVVQWEKDCGLAQLYANLPGRTADARRHLRSLVEEGPDAPFVWECAGRIQQELGDYEDALRNLQRFADGLGAGESEEISRAFAMYTIATIFADMGDMDRARAAFAEFLPAHTRMRARCPRTCSNTPLAMMYAYLGDADRALENLELSISVGWVEHHPDEPHVARSFARISGDPRYQKVMGDLRAHLERQRALLQRQAS